MVCVLIRYRYMVRKTVVRIEIAMKVMNMTEIAFLLREPLLSMKIH